MKFSSDDPLDRALDALEREVTPQRDLWPDIEARLELGTLRGRTVPVWRSSRAVGLAAAVLLVIASSLTTYIVMRGSQQDPLNRLAHDAWRVGTLDIQPASFGAQPLGAGYEQARAALVARFQTQLSTMPPVARAKLERDLAELQRAAREVSATLRQYPSDPLLQELLLSAYQSELQLFGDVNDMTTQVPLAETRTDL